MKLFVAHCWHDRETYEFVGVFSTRELADTALDRFRTGRSGRKYVDTVTLDMSTKDER